MFFEKKFLQKRRKTTELNKNGLDSHENSANGVKRTFLSAKSVTAR